MVLLLLLTKTKRLRSKIYTFSTASCTQTHFISTLCEEKVPDSAFCGVSHLETEINVK